VRAQRARLAALAIAVVLIALLTILGPGLKQIYQDIVDELNAI